ncbi:hypothetical protein ACLQ2N_27485 [Streptomyces sp. DT224]|uniref:hypothetical protein n=1 Tax=Streptomyces sp. DT224 TaxID=3393426 RepID=UPI003CE70BD2
MTAPGAARVVAMQQRCAFVRLGGVRTTVIFTLAIPLSHGYGLLPGLVLPPAGTAASFAGAAALATEGAAAADRARGWRAEHRDGVGPTAPFAIPRALGSDTSSLAAPGAALAASPL